MASASSRSDEALLEEARAGDKQAFRLLVDRFYPVLAVTVTAMLKGRVDVEDVLQDVFIQFYGNMNKFRGEASVKTYLTRIAVNKSLDALRMHKRKTKRVTTIDSVDLEKLGSTGNESKQYETRESVWNAIDRLSPNHRAVVVMRLIEGYSTEETAKLLGIRYGTVLSRLSRAVDQLKEELAPELHAES